MKYYQLNIYTKKNFGMVQPVIDGVMAYLMENGIAGCWNKSEIDRCIENAWEVIKKDWAYFDQYKDNIVVEIEEIEIEE